jgi:PadR family transcriptional regulator, regulatory protein PadR
MPFVPTRANIRRDFLRGFIKIHILHHANDDAVYGVEFMSRLSEDGYHLSPGTLYPLLHTLEQAGYIAREDRVVEGKIRKYYRITPLGRQALHEARAHIRHLTREVLEPEERERRELATPREKIPA